MGDHVGTLRAVSLFSPTPPATAPAAGDETEEGTVDLAEYGVGLI